MQPKFRAGFCPTFFNFAGARKGIKKWRRKMAKIGVRKAKFYFLRHSFGFHFRPLLSVPTSEPEMRWTRPTKFWRQEHSQARSQGPQWQVIIQDLFLKIWNAVVNKLLLLTSAMQLWWNQTQAPYWYTLPGHTHAKPFLLGKSGTDFLFLAARVRESKIPAQGLHSTCAGALAVQKGQLEVCPFQVDRNYVLNL